MKSNTFEKIPVLFVQKKSNYKTIDSFDCYDEDRDALTYVGDTPVIAHPPCRLFSRLRKLSTADNNEKLLAYFAVDLIRKNGGVLEHPMGSLLWKEKDLPLPGNVDKYGGFTVQINQSWFGFPTPKQTYLYIVGIPYSHLPPCTIVFHPPLRSFANLTKNQRSETPKPLIYWLEKIIYRIRNNQLHLAKHNQFHLDKI
jgi:hypothetical protein